MNQISATPSPLPNARPPWQRSVAISVGLRVECRKAERWRREVVYQTRKLNRCADKGKCADGGPQVKKLPPCCCVFAEALLTSLKRIQISSTISLIFGLGSVNTSAGSALLSAFLIQSPIHSPFALSQFPAALLQAVICPLPPPWLFYGTVKANCKLSFFSLR